MTKVKRVTYILGKLIQHWHEDGNLDLVWHSGSHANQVVDTTLSNAPNGIFAKLQERR